MATVLDSDAVLEGLSEDVRAFYSLSSVRRLDRPSEAKFLQHAVSVHQPCIITGILDHWPGTC